MEKTKRENSVGDGALVGLSSFCLLCSVSGMQKKSNRGSCCVSILANRYTASVRGLLQSNFRGRPVRGMKRVVSTEGSITPVEDLETLEYEGSLQLDAHNTSDANPEFRGYSQVS